MATYECDHSTKAEWADSQLAREREKERDVLSYIGVVWNSELEKISGQSRRTRHTFIDLTIWVWYTLDCGFLWISSHFGW